MITYHVLWIVGETAPWFNRLYDTPPMYADNMEDINNMLTLLEQLSEFNGKCIFTSLETAQAKRHDFERFKAAEEGDIVVSTLWNLTKTLGQKREIWEHYTRVVILGASPQEDMDLWLHFSSEEEANHVLKGPLDTLDCQVWNSADYKGMTGKEMPVMTYEAHTMDMILRDQHLQCLYAHAQKVQALEEEVKNMELYIEIRRARLALARAQAKVLAARTYEKTKAEQQSPQLLSTMLVQASEQSLHPLPVIAFTPEDRSTLQSYEARQGEEKERMIMSLVPNFDVASPSPVPMTNPIGAQTMSALLEESFPFVTPPVKSDVVLMHVQRTSGNRSSPTGSVKSFRSYVPPVKLHFVTETQSVVFDESEEEQDATSVGESEPPKSPASQPGSEPDMESIGRPDESRASTHTTSTGSETSERNDSPGSLREFVVTPVSGSKLSEHAWTEDEACMDCARLTPGHHEPGCAFEEDDRKKARLDSLKAQAFMKGFAYEQASREKKTPAVIDLTWEGVTKTSGVMAVVDFVDLTMGSDDEDEEVVVVGQKRGRT